MRYALTPLLLCTAITAGAAEPPPPRDPFPADFVVSPCAPAQSCITFGRSQMSAAAFSFLALKLDPNWVEAHADEMERALAPACRRHATCLTHPANSYNFCNDVLSAETADDCDVLFPASKSATDHEQCSEFHEVYLLGVDQRSPQTWNAAQACAAKNPIAHTKPLDIWMVPATIPFGTRKEVEFFSLDPDTRVPVLANINIQDQLYYAPANPTGKLATFYPFKLPFKFIRVPNAEGHTSLVPPMVTVEAEGYPPTQFPLAAPVPEMKVEMRPAPSALRRGKNVVTIQAHDAATGEPVEARVMVGDRTAGPTNTPITLEVKRGRLPEIWVTSLFNKYSDVVVAKAR